MSAAGMILDGVTSTGRGTLDLDEDDGVVAVEVVISDTATVQFEGRVLEDGTFRQIEGIDMSDPTAAGSSSTGSTGMFQVPVGGLEEFAANVTSITAGDVTVRAKSASSAPASF